MEHVGSLSGHRGEVLCVHSPGDDLRVASGGEDGSVRIWYVATGRAARALLMPTTDSANAVNSVCLGGGLTEASNWLFAASGVNVYGFDLRAPGVLLKEPAKRFNAVARDEIGHLALHEAAGVLAAADDMGDVHVIDVGLPRGNAAHPLGNSPPTPAVALSGVHASVCSWLAFRPGATSSELCSAGLDALCVRWDWRLGAKISAWPVARGYAEWVAGEVHGSSGEAGSSSSHAGGNAADQSTSPAAVPEPQGQREVCNPRFAHCVSYVPDGGALALALGDGTVEVRLADSGEPICAVDAHRASASQCLFAPQLLPALCGGASEVLPLVRSVPLITAGDDRRVRLWSVEGATRRGTAGREGEGGAKRRRHAEAAMDVDGEAAGEEPANDEPGFRSLCTIRLPRKPNGVAAAAEAGGAGHALVCVATTGEALELLKVTST